MQRSRLSPRDFETREGEEVKGGRADRFHPLRGLSPGSSVKLRAPDAEPMKSSIPPLTRRAAEGGKHAWQRE